MSTNRTRIELPQPGNHTFYELPRALQLQIAALGHLEAAESALDSAEHDGRALEYCDDPTDRAEWRNRQRDSLAAYHLRQRLEARAQLAYFRWAIARWEETREGSPAYVMELHRREVETDAKLALLAQEA